MKKIVLMVCIILMCISFLKAQQHNNSELPTSINQNGQAPHSSAMLEVNSQNKGMLTPRMTTAQREAIANPANGLLVFDTTTESFWYYTSAAWQPISDGKSAIEEINEYQMIEIENEGEPINGYSVDISGDYAIVCASGKVFIYHFDGNRWFQQTELSINNGEIYSRKVAISGDHVIVGGDANAYIYKRINHNWELQKTFSYEDVSDGSFSYGGTTVDITGDFAIVGNPPAPNYDNNDGCFFLYKRDGSDWIEQKKICRSAVASLTNLGIAVSISADYAVIGDTKHGTHYASQEAYVYTQSNGVWEFDATLKPDSGTPGYVGSFGSSISVSGDHIAINSCIFRKINGNWVQEAMLLEEQPGGSNSISGNYVVVGNQWDVTDNLKIYKRSVNGWKLHLELSPSDSKKFSSADVRFDNDRIIVVKRENIGTNTLPKIYFYNM